MTYEHVDDVNAAAVTLAVLSLEVVAALALTVAVHHHRRRAVLAQFLTRFRLIGNTVDIISSIIVCVRGVRNVILHLIVIGVCNVIITAVVFISGFIIIMLIILIIIVRVLYNSVCENFIIISCLNGIYNY